LDPLNLVLDLLVFTSLNFFPTSFIDIDFIRLSRLS